MNTRRKDFDGPFQNDRPFLKRNQYWSREFVVSYLGKIDWLFRGYIYIIAQRSKDRENLRKWIIFFSSTKTIASRNRNFWSLKFRNDRTHDEKFFFDTYLLIYFRPIIWADVFFLIPKQYFVSLLCTPSRKSRDI